MPAPPGTLDLSTGEPSLALLPRLRGALTSVADRADEPVGYASAGPLPELVELARERLAVDGLRLGDPTSGSDRGAAVTVTSGTLDAIERLLGSRLRPGDRVGIEDPGWANLIDLVAALGLEPVPMPLDDEGPTPDGVRRAIGSGVAAIVVTSRAQNPTGACVTPERAARLRRVLAGARDVLVIEDDHAAELALQPLATLAVPGRPWALTRSVSKPYGPDLRVAIVAGDPATISRVQGRMRLGSGWVSTVLQRLVVALWRDPQVAATVARARIEYAARREALLVALARRGVAAQGRSGINIWVSTSDESAAVAGLRDLGYAAAPGSLYRLASPPGMRLCIANLDQSDVERLADAVAMAVGAADGPSVPSFTV